MALFEALYVRKCRSPVGWFEPGETQLLGPDLVQQALEKVALIRERLRTTQSRQKSYADKRVRDLEFMKGEKVFLKVSPMKGVMRFGRKGKLSPRYIGPYEILDRIGSVAYKLALPPRLSAVHPVFHVSMLRRYVRDDSHKIQPEDVELDENLTYKESLIAIIDRQVRQLRSKKVASVKVLWRNHPTEEATWESEADMQRKYPQLFEISVCLYFLTLVIEIPLQEIELVADEFVRVDPIAEIQVHHSSLAISCASAVVTETSRYICRVCRSRSPPLSFV
ncbi:uncharacterized protein [Nicotiana sylvestris]|uniref:uncharacterized protein n=1 Tax=Nicotiana sylvestris TaxID=4096 RepID=UPI00388C5C65